MHDWGFYTESLKSSLEFKPAQLYWWLKIKTQKLNGKCWYEIEETPPSCGLYEYYNNDCARLWVMSPFIDNTTIWQISNKKNVIKSNETCTSLALILPDFTLDLLDNLGENSQHVSCWHSSFVSEPFMNHNHSVAMENDIGDIWRVVRSRGG